MTSTSRHPWRCPQCRNIGFYLRYKPEPDSGIPLHEVYYSDPERNPPVGMPACEHCGFRPESMARVSDGYLITYKEFVDLVEW